MVLFLRGVENRRQKELDRWALYFAYLANRPNMAIACDPLISTLTKEGGINSVTTRLSRITQ